LPWRYPRNYLAEGRAALTHPLLAMDHEETFEQARRLELAFHQPYWDVDVIEFLFRTPPDVLNRGGRAKGIVRKSLTRRFPDLGFERQRKVVSLDFARTLFREEGARAWKLYGGVSVLGEAGIVDVDEANRMVESILLDPASRSTDRLWDLLTCEAWLRTRL
jgi:hypothetical protein